MINSQVILMLRRELVILFLVGCLILASVPTALCRSPAPIIYVAGDGSGDFNCDGKDDHVQINQALKFVAENSDGIQLSILKVRLRTLLTILF